MKNIPLALTFILASVIATTLLGCTNLNKHAAPYSAPVSTAPVADSINQAQTNAAELTNVLSKIEGKDESIQPLLH
jgi:FlaG/FlaF family flagellin (archaellin)